jgi:hypothetical protein
MTPPSLSRSCPRTRSGLPDPSSAWGGGKVHRDKIGGIKGLENQLRALFGQELLSGINWSIVLVENPTPEAAGQVISGE